MIKVEEIFRFKNIWCEFVLFSDKTYVANVLPEYNTAHISYQLNRRGWPVENKWDMTDMGLFMRGIGSLGAWEETPDDLTELVMNSMAEYELLGGTIEQQQ